MMRQKLLVGTIALLTFTGGMSAAYASPKDSFLNPEKDSNHAAIREGVENGDLDHHEAHKLLKDQHKVDRYEDKARSNGKISKKELKRLDKMRAEQHDAIEEKTESR